MRAELFFPPRNFAGLSPPLSTLEAARVVILPVPYDSTSEWRGGKREGCQAIIDASQYLELYDLELDREIFRVGIHTLPELQPDLDSPARTIERVYQVVGGLLQQGKVPLLLGGEHSLSLGAIRACQEAFPRLSVLHLDAHADLREEYLGTKYSHACVMRRVLELCPVVSAGVRSLAAEEMALIRQRGLQPFYAHELGEEVLPRLVERLSPEVYISLDLDVLDPSIMTAVGNPEPGGLGWYQLLYLLLGVSRQRRVVGADLMEFSPREGPISCAFLAAKLTYKLIGYITDGI